MSASAKFFMRVVAAALLVAVAFVPVFWVYRWNIDVYQSRLLSALIAGVFVGIAAAIYRLVVHPTATLMDKQWKQQRSGRADSDA